MRNVENRAVTKSLCLKDSSATEIHNEINDGLKDSSASFTTDKWFHEFKYGFTIVQDAPHSRCLKYATAPGIVEKLPCYGVQDYLFKTSETNNAINRYTEI